MQDLFKDRHTDKGWSTMRVILDQEMPTEPKHRRFIGWWLAGLSILLLGCGSWFWWKASQPVKYPKKQSFAVLNTPFFTPEDTNTRLNEKNRPLHTEQGQLKVTASSFPLRVNPTGTKAQNVFQHKNTGDAATTPSSNPVSSQFIDFTLKHNPTDAVESLPAYKFVALEPLTNRSLSPIQSDQQPELDLMLKHLPLPDKKARHWRLQIGVNSSLTTDNFHAINGVSGGMSMQWPLTGRWGIRSGLNLHQYTPSSNKQPVAAVATSDVTRALQAGYLLTDNMGNLVTNSTGAIPAGKILVPAKKLFFVEIPLLVSYRISNKTRLFGGVSTSYVTAIQTGDEGYLGSLLITGYANKDLNKLAVHNLQRWRVCYQLGVGAMLRKNIELGVSASLPLRSYASVSSKDDANFQVASADNRSSENIKTSLFSVGATYFFR